jgi:hypothetical protein
MFISIERDNVHAYRYDITEIFKHVKHPNPNPLHVQENELSILSNKKLFSQYICTYKSIQNQTTLEKSLKISKSEAVTQRTENILAKRKGTANDLQNTTQKTKD